MKTQLEKENEIKFNRIYKKYNKIVTKICKYYALKRYNTILRDDVYADISQNVWLFMFERIDKLDEERNLKYYITRYAMNTSILYFEYQKNKIFSAGHRVPLDWIENLEETKVGYDYMTSLNLYTEQSDIDHHDLYFAKYVNPYLTDVQLRILDFIKEGYKHLEIEMFMNMNTYYYRLELTQLRKVLQAKAKHLYYDEDFIV